MKNLEYKKYWIWLSMIKGLGVKKKQFLLEKYKNPENIYQLKEKELSTIKGIGEKGIQNILDKNVRKNIENNLKFMLQHNIGIISINEEKYPQQLKEIYDPPISLYYKGNIDILKEKSIAVIGCRDASEYGKKAAKYFSYNLAKQKLNIVSGLAKGIDSYAHIGTICANKEEAGKAIAVLGNGLDQIYPKENEILAKYILETDGVILSEYPLGTKPEKMNFPARNRIVSGLSKGVLVVEAKEKSGTMITVDFALEQGRDVFVVPGNINSIYSVGTNQLIQQGAKLVTNYTEIF